MSDLLVYMVAIICPSFRSLRGYNKAARVPIQPYRISLVRGQGLSLDSVFTLMANLQITTRVGCRVACTYCPQDLFVNTYGARSDCTTMRLEQFKALLITVPETVGIWFAGMCESWLNPECTQMALYASGKGHRVSAFSTLVGMQVSDVKALECIPFDFFRVHVPSLSGSEKIPVDKMYLNTLSALLRSSIRTTFHCHEPRPHPQVVERVTTARQSIRFPPTYHRSGNLTRKSSRKMPRRQGQLACKRKRRNNILLPNGDVLLCSNDYGHQHILGNLFTTSYEALFEGREYQRIETGAKEASEEILCRYCEEFCINHDRHARLLNGRFLLNKASIDMKCCHSVADWLAFGKRVVRKLTRGAQ